MAYGKKVEKKMSHSAKDWAKFLLFNAEKYYPDVAIPNLKLQYLMYLFQREYIRRFNRQAFFEQIEAWNYGPCIPEVFYTYCGFGGMPIRLGYAYISEAYGKILGIHDLTFPEVNCIMDVLERYSHQSIRKLHEYLTGPGNAYQKALAASSRIKSPKADKPVIDTWLIQRDKAPLENDDDSDGREVREMIPKRDLLKALEAIHADEKIIRLVEGWMPEGDYDNG